MGVKIADNGSAVQGIGGGCDEQNAGDQHGRLKGPANYTPVQTCAIRRLFRLQNVLVKLVNRECPAKQGRDSEQAYARDGYIKLPVDKARIAGYDWKKLQKMQNNGGTGNTR
jgi:hypothetical protein